MRIEKLVTGLWIQPDPLVVELVSMQWEISLPSDQVREKDRQPVRGVISIRNLLVDAMYVLPSLDFCHFLLTKSRMASLESVQE